MTETPIKEEWFRLSGREQLQADEDVLRILLNKRANYLQSKVHSIDPRFDDSWIDAWHSGYIIGEDEDWERLPTWIKMESRPEKVIWPDCPNIWYLIDCFNNEAGKFSNMVWDSTSNALSWADGSETEEMERMFGQEWFVNQPITDLLKEWLVSNKKAIHDKADEFLRNYYIALETRVAEHIWSDESGLFPCAALWFEGDIAIKHGGEL